MEDADAAKATAVVRAHVAAQVAGVMAAHARVVVGSSGAIDEEAVHDYRVGLRRLRSGLRAIRPSWGKSILRPLEAQLKALADATGDVRDEEVLVETLRSLDLDGPVATELARWSVGRGRRLAGARAVAGRKLAGPTLGGALASALYTVETTLAISPRRPMRAADLRRRSIGRAMDDIESRAAATTSDDVEGMHALRIRVKRLRYGVELLCEGQDEAARVLELAKRLQKRLGELHDVDEAQVRVARAWGLSPAARASIGAALASRRETVARKARRDLDAVVPSLREAVATLIEGG